MCLLMSYTTILLPIKFLRPHLDLLLPQLQWLWNVKTTSAQACEQLLNIVIIVYRICFNFRDGQVTKVRGSTKAQAKELVGLEICGWEKCQVHGWWGEFWVVKTWFSHSFHNSPSTTRKVGFVNNCSYQEVEAKCWSEEWEETHVVKLRWLVVFKPNNDPPFCFSIHIYSFVLGVRSAYFQES